jgi:hypothetical protein
LCPPEGAKTLASTPKPKKLISATKKTSRISWKEKATGSPATNQYDLASAVSKREKIALLAYAYWEQRGCPIGSPEEDWSRADPLEAHASGKDVSWLAKQEIPLEKFFPGKELCVVKSPLPRDSPGFIA